MELERAGDGVSFWAILHVLLSGPSYCFLGRPIAFAVRPFSGLARWLNGQTAKRPFSHLAKRPSRPFRLNSFFRQL